MLLSHVTPDMNLFMNGIITCLIKSAAKEVNYQYEEANGYDDEGTT